MPDLPKRIYGPSGVGFSVARTLYTVPKKTKTYVRDISICNTDQDTALQGQLKIGTTVVLTKSIPAGTTYPFRGLWLMDEGEILTGRQTTTDATPLITADNNANGAAVNTLNITNVATFNPGDIAFIAVSQSKTDAPDIPTVTDSKAANIWTNLGSTSTGSIGGTDDIRVTLFGCPIVTTKPNGDTTTINWSANQALVFAQNGKATNVQGAVMSPYSWPVQSIGAADSAAPGATNAGLPLTFGSALTGGFVIVLQAKLANETYTPPTDFTAIGSGAGGVALNMKWSYSTAWPRTDTTVGAGTWSVSNTIIRAAMGYEFTPNLQNGMLVYTVNAVEVLQ